MKTNFSLKDVKVQGIEIGNVEMAVEINLEELIELSRQRKEFIENAPKMMETLFTAFKHYDGLAREMNRPFVTDDDN